MGKSNQIKINTKIELQRIGDSEYFASSIQDIKDDILYISMPTLFSQETLFAQPLVLVPGEEVKVRFPGTSESFVFTSTFIDAVKDPIVLYRLTMPNAIKRIQQRNYVRVETLLEVFVAEIPEIGEEPNYYKVNALDISGGGMRLLMELLSDKPYTVGKELLVKFYISEQENRETEVRTKIQVRRKDLLPTLAKHEKQLLYSFGVEFIEISEKLRQEIIKFIFRKMAMRRQVLGR